MQDTYDPILLDSLLERHYSPSKKDKSCADKPPVFPLVGAGPFDIGVGDKNGWLRAVGGVGRTAGGGANNVGFNELEFTEGGGGRFHDDAIFTLGPLFNIAGDEDDDPNEATAAACWDCIVEPKKSVGPLDMECGGAGKASGRGEGGASHRPRAAAVSIKLIVREWSAFFDGLREWFA